MKNKLILPLTIITFFTVSSFISPLIFDPYNINLEKRLSPPDLVNIFGTDELGRDLFVRIFCGLKISIKLTLLTLILSISLGGIMGSIAGYFGKYLDFFLTKLIDLLLALPGILLAIVIMTFFRRGELPLLFALTLTSWIGYARIARSLTLRLKTLGFMEWSSVSGASYLHLFKNHIFPNIFPILSAQASSGAASIIMTESGLSFLGLGLPPPEPSLGQIVSSGSDYLLEAPHIIIFSSLCLLVLLWSLYKISDALRESIK